MAKRMLQAISLASAISATPSWAASAANETLWSNLDNGYVQITSQNFEASFDNYDTQGADDFLVPAGEAWIVKQVGVNGSYGGGAGPARSQNVVFYRIAHGLPGSVVKAYPEVKGTPDNFGSFLITLPETLKLKPGKYWISVQVNMDFGVGGQWGWMTTSSDRKGLRAVWKNPGDGFQTGCTDYGPMRKCIGHYGEGPDFEFVLYGKRKPSELAPSQFTAHEEAADTDR